MKTLFSAVLLTFFVWKSYGATTPQSHHYVVIGAFAIKKNAERFILHAAQHNLTARYEINPERNLYYVYVLLTDDRNEAIQTALRIRKDSPYNDTWVFKGILGAAVGNHGAEDINPLTQQTTESIVISDVLSAQREHQNANTIEKVSSSPQNEVIASSSFVPSVTTENAAPDQRKMVFSLYRADNRDEINGDVLAIDMERSRKVGSFEANKPVRMFHPGNKSGEVLLIAEVFGYRKAQRSFNFTSPNENDLKTDEEGNLIIPFEMVRLQKGDIAVMYNVYFFKDAAVMRPESRWEVNSLLDMLKENPRYKIRIHGHTNGNAPGKIISRNPKSDNFFSLSDTREGYGSAKKLSQERAEVIREYLLANGIEASRMQIKAWGGKRPVVDKLHTLAESNVRVEIEILEH
ncbi:MAG: OmpA family protein [Cyclobacteriaceae bacterium]|nr:OmpA family protein [Cyclobacteriaceae bacterium]MDW8330006.1 OmpA family protein [Cyclobacteriaceae bacterium]